MLVNNLYVFHPGLPLYHSSALVLGVGLMMSCGGRIVIAKKFSVTRFWDDCHRYDANVIQYIGELCRYLVMHQKLF